MEKAYLVIDERVEELVSAADVDYSDYRKIFQCPYCKETLYLVEGYHEKNGRYVGPLFRHPKGDPDDCEWRSDWDNKPKKGSELDWIPRGQSRTKLERAFLDFFKRCARVNTKPIFPGSKFVSEFIIIPEGIDIYQGKEDYLKRYIAYNKEAQIHESPELLIKACSRILDDSRVDKFFLESTRKFQDELIDKKDDLEYFKRHSEVECTSKEKLIKSHCRRLNRIAMFLCRGSSEKLRQDFLEIIVWANSNKLPLHYVSINTKEDRERDRIIEGSDFIQALSVDEECRKHEIMLRQKGVQELRPFDSDMLSKICNDSTYMTEAFRKFYAGEGSP